MSGPVVKATCVHDIDVQEHGQIIQETLKNSRLATANKNVSKKQCKVQFIDGQRHNILLVKHFFDQQLSSPIGGHQTHFTPDLRIR